MISTNFSTLEACSISSNAFLTNSWIFTFSIDEQNQSEIDGGIRSTNFASSTGNYIYLDGRKLSTLPGAFVSYHSQQLLFIYADDMPSYRSLEIKSGAPILDSLLPQVNLYYSSASKWSTEPKTYDEVTFTGIQWNDIGYNFYKDMKGVLLAYNKNLSKRQNEIDAGIQSINYASSTGEHILLGGRKLSSKISNDVKSGNIAYNINKPYSYIEYALFTHLGDIFIKSIIYTILGISLGFILLGSIPTLNIISILVILLTCILATTISTLIIIFISLFSFFIEDASPIYWIYSKFILILGTIFPIEYFPISLQGILKYSPIYVVSYGPAKLFVNYNSIEAIKILVAQTIYIVITFIICKLFYNKGVKKINVNGG